ncbi:hypothetical protein BCR33DRAFT_844954 [Rhizoclosmatium globosum]|uniref:Secreted protein n=1 Tax=Rhizoclosmatium globosum TaxID=329046 RepID=A0A1Y2D3K1_9FUNG|nr:hypothetical protein BCR33DRAFT_844954 [Rhizoclosmatium globosum]|eukprot:ORY53686.1 hypothetical protein BCR33DRAFT_844954 [Rhizoclosmatium globosum]
MITRFISTVCPLLLLIILASTVCSAEFIYRTTWCDSAHYNVIVPKTVDPTTAMHDVMQRYGHNCWGADKGNGEFWCFLPNTQKCPVMVCRDGDFVFPPNPSGEDWTSHVFDNIDE